MSFGPIFVWSTEEHHAAHVRLAAHDVARVDFDRAAAADHHDTAMPGEHLEIFGEVHVRQHLEDQVYAFAAGALHDRGGVVRCFVVEDGLCTLLGEQRASCVG